MKITDHVLCAHQDVWTRQKYHWLFLGENLLQTVVKLFTLFVTGRGKLLLHQPVDFCLPCCGGVRPRWSSEMRFSPLPPEHHVSCWVRIQSHEAQPTRVELHRV